VFIEVPARYVGRDRDESIVFNPDGVRFLDRLRVMAMRVPTAPTPGYIRTLREALDLTQADFGQRVGVEKMTVWRWEHGQLKPSPASVKAIESLRRQAARKGVLLAG
jgi:DNA-binding XRE family transcriptional regulator